MANGNGMQGLLGSPLLNIGAGLLSAAGPSLDPGQVGVGRGLLAGVQQAQNAQTQQLRNQVRREQLEQLSRQREARGRLAEEVTGEPGFGEAFDASPFVSTEAGPAVGPIGQPSLDMPASETQGLLAEQTAPQREMLGLLAEAAPETFTEGLLAQQFDERSAPSDIRTMRALGLPETPEGFQQFQQMQGDQRAATSLVRNLNAAGIDPASDEGRDIIKQNLAGAGQLEQLDTILKGLEIDKLRGDLADRERSETQERTEVRNALRGQVRAMTEIAEINERLRGTMAETGLPLPELRRVFTVAGTTGLTEQLGLPQDEARRLASDLQRFETLATRETVGNMETLLNTGNITNNEFDTLMDTGPGMHKLPEANALGVADNLERTLEAADAIDMEIPNRQEVEQRIQDLREMGQPTESGTGQRSEGRRGRERPRTQGQRQEQRQPGTVPSDRDRFGRFAGSSLQDLTNVDLGELSDRQIAQWERAMNAAEGRNGE